MTNYAVLIGNSQFLPEADLKPLTSPTKDVEGLAMTLKIEEGGLFEKVITLVNQSTRDTLRSINHIFKNAGKNDLILLYYSGHGLPNNKNNDLYLATADTEVELLESTALSFDQLYKWIAQSYCKKVVIILDCCYSGTAGQVFKGDLSSQLQTFNDKVMGTCLMTAASNDQVALDNSEGGYSLFTKHLINGLRGEAARDDSGLVTQGELFHYVREKVSSDNPSQIPKRFLKDENGEIVLAKSDHDSRRERAKKLVPFFYDLTKEDKISHEILTKTLNILRMSTKNLSEHDRSRDILISECFSTCNTVAFIREWEKLGEIETPNHVIEKENPIEEPKGQTMLRRLMILAVVSFVSFIVLLASDDISPYGMNIFDTKGLKLLTNLAFMVSAATLGACASTLLEVNNSIVNQVFDPKHTLTYWINVLIGISVGFFLVNLVPIDPSSMNGMGKAFLAMFGGFLVPLVHRAFVVFSQIRIVK